VIALLECIDRKDHCKDKHEKNQKSTFNRSLRGVNLFDFMGHSSKLLVPTKPINFVEFFCRRWKKFKIILDGVFVFVLNSPPLPIIFKLDTCTASAW